MYARKTQHMLSTIPLDVSFGTLPKIKELHKRFRDVFECGDVLVAFAFTQRDDVRVGDYFFISPSQLNRVGELLRLRVSDVSGDGPSCIANDIYWMVKTSERPVNQRNKSQLL